MQFDRRPDWPERLLLAISEHRKGDFKWGEYDCGTLFSDCVYAMTGGDPMEAFGRWHSEQSALRRLIETGFETIKDYMDANLDRVAPSLARRGDVGYPAEIVMLSCPAIIVGSEAISRNQSGWVTLPAATLVAAYRIG